jgi:CubicO group peptidase (beta-lactamase class C family)
VAGAAVAIVGLNVIVGRPAAPAGPADDAAIEAYVAGRLGDAGIPGGAVAIVRDGKVSDVRGFGVADTSGRPIGPTTPFVLGSVSKPITALAVMQLVESGRIALDAPITRYLPDFRVADPTAADKISVRDLLEQTSGLPTSAGELPLAAPVSSIDDQVRSLAAVQLTANPGASFTYSNANYEVLGELVERVSGESFGRYVQDHVFGPLGMTHAHVDLASARADGLTDAHRLWFGLPDDHTPLWRPDFLPAGWVIASPSDMAQLLVAELDGGRTSAGQVLSASGIAETQAGVAPMGGPDAGSYGLGWVDTKVGDVRVIAHAGSTTDMASAVMFAPDRGLGIVILFNGQSTLYELFRKPDSITLAAFQQLLGQAPTGTLTLFYPAFDLAALLLIAYTTWHFLTVVRRAHRGEPLVGRFIRSHRLAIAVAIWLNLVVPVAILTRLPDLLAAPWWILVRLDIGLVAFVFAILRLATGAALVVGVTYRWRQRVASATPALAEAAVLA